MNTALIVIIIVWIMIIVVICKLMINFLVQLFLRIIVSSSIIVDAIVHTIRFTFIVFLKILILNSSKLIFLFLCCFGTDCFLWNSRTMIRLHNLNQLVWAAFIDNLSKIFRKFFWNHRRWTCFVLKLIFYVLRFTNSAHCNIKFLWKLCSCVLVYFWFS